MECSKDIVEKHNGKVPSDKESLKALSGVGEKTANVVLSMAFNVPAIAVDTHVFRVSNRLGLANSHDVLHTQKDLEKMFRKTNGLSFITLWFCTADMFANLKDHFVKVVS